MTRRIQRTLKVGTIVNVGESSCFTGKHRRQSPETRGIQESANSAGQTADIWGHELSCYIINL